ncbi:hypothetical protein PR202_ga02482 [Eleusine coracana subsp. coracana]|uniref:F-box domain-containing protein n=1 Tax=Eleusine coracana subsp. coracana TaxID=191504 RepID=A0AAV5BMC5_ELECO|nr:hypothetical protein PR202_ga02482 [Eleusine coracana subsp. coracana]
MPMPIMNHSMSRQRQELHPQTQASNRSIAPQAERNISRGQQHENFLGHQIKICAGPSLPEEIWSHIHSLMPMQDAARVACVSKAFLHSWRCHPDLSFTEETLGLNKNACVTKDETAKIFTSRVDHILRKHSGIGIKTFKLNVASVYNLKGHCHLDRLDWWLQIAIKPGIEEISLSLSLANAKFNFPHSLLSDGIGDSLRSLHLTSCNFHPTVGLGCLRSLASLHLSMVCITEGELERLLTNSFALERLELKYCSEIICLKIPCLPRLSYLEVLICRRLQLIESKASNLSSFRFAGEPHVQFSLAETSRIKKLDWLCSGATFYACTELPISMPNLETLTIHSRTETVNTPMVSSKFLHLKLLNIALGGQTYDYFSLVSFFFVAPSLETFILNVQSIRMGGVSVFADPSNLRRMAEQRHDRLKRVDIINFSSIKSLVELTCYIVESATSLERLTLDTTHAQIPQEILKQQNVASLAIIQASDLRNTISNIHGSTDEDAYTIAEVDELRTQAINIIDFYCPLEYM